MKHGERLNNPMNVKHSPDVFRGEDQGVADPLFKAFLTVEDGIRCGAKILLNYQRMRDLKTVTGIIGRWAPPIENLTKAYVADVSSRMNVAADTVLNLLDADVLTSLCSAIIFHENGECIYTVDQVKTAAQDAIDS